MRKGVVLPLVLIVFSSLGFGQSLLFKHNTGIPYRTNYVQSLNAHYIALAPGSTPIGIILTVSSYPTNGAFSYLVGPNEGRFIVLDPRGTLRFNLSFSNLGITFAPQPVPSPTGSIIFQGYNYYTNDTGTLTNTLQRAYYKYNRASKNWTFSTSLPLSNSLGIMPAGQNGTQANCAIWCNTQNEGGNLVAYVYSW